MSFTTPSPSPTQRAPKRSRNANSSPFATPSPSQTRNTPKTKRARIQRTPLGVNNDNNNNNSSENTIPFDSIKSVPEGCEWWPYFAVKITNLVNLLKSDDRFNYVLVGSGANALLTYFYRPELLKTLPMPEDGDILIRPKNYKRCFGIDSKPTFIKLSILKIGKYIIDEKQKNENSATFYKNSKKANNNNKDKSKAKEDITKPTFSSIDVNIVTGMISYFKVHEFAILNIDDMIGNYNEFLGTPMREGKHNEEKIHTLKEVKKDVGSGVVKIVMKEFSKNNNNRNSKCKITKKNNIGRGGLQKVPFSFNN